MKLTAEQTATIKQLVYNEVKYNETYHEFYDHVVTALEHREQITDIQKAYAEILSNDFAGHSSLEKLEQRNKQLISAKTSQVKWDMFWSFFKWPVLPLTIAFIVLVYFLAGFDQFKLTIVMVVLAAAILPWFFVVIGNFIIGLKKTYIKRSIRDDAVNAMAGYMFRLYWKINVYAFLINVLLINTKILPDIHLSFQVTVTFCFIFCTLYTIAVLKTYYYEFKILVLK